ncbi:hypothetical protein HJG54_19165 [Leptolyngbya sp. NK1-12]|uniref:Uncharacterized protein n=1 Tax=Leptolyngbya sp. NK1-12 TaxID=2547451 RepID=A0AA97ALK5_9CYAN|nr:hypothetical protein [Leptolyngbya sp. NK1-12]WNZ24752.1 hypothetical protein HJG54_19165 [Leptolyngbya sp. NK1-12]
MIKFITIGLLGLIVLLSVLLIGEAHKQNQQQRRKRYQRIPVIVSKREKNHQPRYQRIPVVPPKRHAPPSPPPVGPSRPLPPPSSSSVMSFLLSPVFSRQKAINPLQPKLLALLNGDRAAAERLLKHAKQNNPGRDETWYFDKVIYDLTRDRH